MLETLQCAWDDMHSVLLDAMEDASEDVLQKLTHQA